MYTHHTGYVGQDRPHFGQDRPHFGNTNTFSSVSQGHYMGNHNLNSSVDQHARPGHFHGNQHGGLSHSKVHSDVVYEEPTAPKFGERSVKKLVQVPVTHEVKVPTVVEKIVEAHETKEIPITRVKQEQAFKTVQEEYVDYEEREVTRMKDVWVKQQVPEKYIERVPVKKVRTVEVPYTATKQYTDVHRIEVPVTRVVEEPGYRVDHVVELETHEVEGKQKIQWIPQVVDGWAEERDLGIRDRQVVDRRIGTTIYSERDHFHTHPVPLSPRKELHYGGAPSDIAHSPRQHLAFTPQSSVASRSSFSASGSSDAHFGLYLKETVLGLIVKAVAPGSAADEAGIEPSDIVVAVDTMEVYSIEDWRRCIGRKTAVTVMFRSKRHAKNVKAILTR